MDDDDHSTASMAFTPGTTIVYDDRDQRPGDISPRPSLVSPSPGNTYIIRDGEEGHALSLFDGHVCLVPSDTLGASIYWKCHETRGWLGFKNLASGQFLGYNVDGSLRTMPHHEGWECFCVRMAPRGFVLLTMSNAQKVWPELWPIRRKNVVDGVQKLEKVKAVAGEGLVWEFVQVHPES